MVEESLVNELVGIHSLLHNQFLARFTEDILNLLMEVIQFFEGQKSHSFLDKSAAKFPGKANIF